MHALIRVAKALADGSRLRILAALKAGELCVCQINALFDLAPSTISKHLSLLNQAGLIRSRKAERWVYYRLADDSKSKAVLRAIDWVHASVGETPEGRADVRKLRTILKQDPKVLCRAQARL